MVYRGGDRVRDPARIDRIMGKMILLWRKYPDWRFGQLFENVAGCHRKGCHFHMVDEDFEKELDRRLEEGFT